MTQVGKINVNQELQEVKNTKTQAGKAYLLNQPIQDSVSFGNKEKEEGMSTSTKIALWATGIAAAAGAIYLAVRKGKTDEVADAAKDAAKNIKNGTNNATDAVQNATEQGKTAVTSTTKKRKKAVTKTAKKNKKPATSTTKKVDEKAYGELTTTEALQKRANAIGADRKPTFDAIQAQNIMSHNDVYVRMNGEIDSLLKQRAAARQNNAPKAEIDNITAQINTLIKKMDNIDKANETFVRKNMTGENGVYGRTANFSKDDLRAMERTFKLAETRRMNSCYSSNRQKLFNRENPFERTDTLKVGQKVDNGLYTVRNIEYGTRNVRHYTTSTNAEILVDTATNKPIKIVCNDGTTYLYKSDGTLGLEYGSTCGDSKLAMKKAMDLLSNPDALKSCTQKEYTTKYIRNMELVVNEEVRETVESLSFKRKLKRNNVLKFNL